MLEETNSPDELALVAADAYRTQDRELQAALHQVPAPLYVTDPDGVITYFNSACIGFSGRTPRVGKDRWCVTWKLYTAAGEFLPHDQCPMADAIRERRSVRGAVAVAERPDGTRVTFTPYPTPILGDDGRLLGAVNILIDITEERQIQDLRAQAMRCRHLALDVPGGATRVTLNRMADEYQEKARALEISRHAKPT